MSMKIVVPDDFPVVLTGSPAERQLRTLGNVTVYTERGAEQETELVRRIGAADIVLSLRAYTRFSESALAACCPYRKIRLSFFSVTYEHSVLPVNLPLLTTPSS